MKSTGRMARSAALASFLGTALVGCAAMDLGVPERAEAGFDVDESYFYMSLSSQGNWVRNAQFGWVWYPYRRSSSWRPYTLGRWVFTNYGEWMWVSDEPFGWATYHYGRWFLDPYYGWVWMPGRVWAPAWVSWRDCDDYVGWAPLGPWGYWDRQRGRYRDWDRWHSHDRDHDRDWDRNWDRRYRTDRDDYDHWNFTRKRDFAGGRADRSMLDRRQVQDVFRRSRDLPPPTEQDEREGRGVSRGLDRREVERAAGRPIRPVRVEDDDAKPGADRGWGQKFDEKSERVKVYRPKVTEAKPDKTPDRLGVAKPSDKDRDPKGGWGRDPHQDDARDRDRNPPVNGDERGTGRGKDADRDDRGTPRDDRGKGSDDRGASRDGRGGFEDDRGTPRDDRGKGSDDRGASRDERGGSNGKDKGTKGQPLWPAPERSLDSDGDAGRDRGSDRNSQQRDAERSREAERSQQREAERSRDAERSQQRDAERGREADRSPQRDAERSQQRDRDAERDRQRDAVRETPPPRGATYGQPREREPEAPRGSTSGQPRAYEPEPSRAPVERSKERSREAEPPPSHRSSGGYDDSGRGGYAAPRPSSPPPPARPMPEQHAPQGMDGGGNSGGGRQGGGRSDGGNTGGNAGGGHGGKGSGSSGDAVVVPPGADRGR